MAFGWVGVVALTGFVGFSGAVGLAGVGAGLALVADNSGTAATLAVLGSADLAGCTDSSVFAARTGVSGASAALALAEGVLFGEVANGFFNSMAPG